MFAQTAGFATWALRERLVAIVRMHGRAFERMRRHGWVWAMISNKDFGCYGDNGEKEFLVLSRGFGVFSWMFLIGLVL